MTQAHLSLRGTHINVPYPRQLRDGDHQSPEDLMVLRDHLRNIADGIDEALNEAARLWKFWPQGWAHGRIEFEVMGSGGVVVPKLEGLEKQASASGGDSTP